MLVYQRVQSSIQVRDFPPHDTAEAETAVVPRDDFAVHGEELPGIPFR